MPSCVIARWPLRRTVHDPQMRPVLACRLLPPLRPVALSPPRTQPPLARARSLRPSRRRILLTRTTRLFLSVFGPSSYVVLYSLCPSFLMPSLLQHPAFGRTRSKFPRRSFHFTDWSFGKAVESLEHWGLLFTVNLAKTGSVYRSLGNQVVAHLTANDILLPGYDARRAWRSPLDLPFVLLSSSGRTTRVHAPYDSLNELTYTVPNILSAKPSLTVIKCPIGEEFMKHELLRLGQCRRSS